MTKEDRKDACHKNLQGYLWENGYKTGAYATPLFPDVAPRLKQWKDAGLTLAIYSSGSVFAQMLLFGHVQVQRSPIVENQANSSVKQRPNVGGKDAAAGQKRSIDDAAGPGGDPRLTDESPSKKAAMSKDDGQANGGEGAASNASQSERAGKVATEDLQYLITDWYDTTNAGPKKEAGSYEKIAEALKVSRHCVASLPSDASATRNDRRAPSRLESSMTIRSAYKHAHADNVPSFNPQRSSF